MAAHKAATKVLRAMIALSLAGATSVGYACECRTTESSLSEALASSEFVFRAVVTSAEVLRNGGTYVTEIGTGELIPFKGGVPPFTKLVSYEKSACGMPVEVPQDYWFFVNKKGELNRCSPTAPADSERVRELEDKVRASVIERREETGDPLGYGNLRSK